MEIGLAILIAGHDTAARAIGNGLWLLLSHPDQLEAVRSDLSLLPAAVEEMLRHDGPVLGFVRTALTSVSIGDVDLPAGANLFLLYGSGSHDPGRFADPERFDISRPTDAHHLGFGRGIHYCLGAPLARAELRIGFERLLLRLPGLRIADPDWQPVRPPNPVLRGLSELVVDWDG